MSFLLRNRHKRGNVTGQSCYLKIWSQKTKEGKVGIWNDLETLAHLILHNRYRYESMYTIKYE